MYRYKATWFGVENKRVVVVECKNSGAKRRRRRRISVFEPAKQRPGSAVVNAIHNLFE